MIELSMESISLSSAERTAALKLRENAILEFSDGETGYLIERLPGDIYDFVHIHRNRAIRQGPRVISLYQAVDFAVLDSQDGYDDSDGLQWLEDLKGAEKQLLGLTSELALEDVERELISQFSPKRAALALEPSSELEPARENSVEIQDALEASIARRGPIIDRVDGYELSYLVQRTDLDHFRFVVLEPGKDPRYADTQTTGLRQVYVLIKEDAKSNYDHYRWFPMKDDLGAFIGRTEAEAESYLILSKLYRSFPELSHDGRKFSEVLAVAEDITRVFDR